MEFRKITLEEMMAYIDKNGDKKDKEWFKSVAIVNGKYNHLKAVRAFCERYMPELLPKKKEKAPKKSDMLMNW